MAAPKRRHSIRVRHISQGNKIKNMICSFRGLGLKKENITRCRSCNRPRLSHFACQTCYIEKIRLVHKKKTLQ